MPEHDLNWRPEPLDQEGQYQLERLLESARRHGDGSGEGHEVGDLRAFLELALQFIPNEVWPQFVVAAQERRPDRAGDDPEFGDGL